MSFPEKPSPVKNDISRRDVLAGALSMTALRGAGTGELRAGPVTVEFEPELGFLRYIKLGDREILRGIYAAVRTSTWLTVPPSVSNIVTDVRERSFKLTFDADCRQDAIHFFWQGTITGDENGTVRFEMNGTAKTTFQRNRLGFCVLHPLTECVGQPYVASKADGSRERGTFPALISPHQPVKDLKSITHTVANGVDAEVSFEGDIFEMEDHRNWTDGNFKTYCTPLEIPFPVEVKQGTVVRQAVTIRLKGTPAPAKATGSGRISMQPSGAKPVPLPKIGLGWAPMTPGQLAAINELRPAHLRVDLKLAETGWQAVLSDAASAGFPLEAAAFVSDNAESELRQLAAVVKVPIARWLVFHTGELVTQAKWVALAKSILKGAPVGGGTNIYFTELNRHRPAAGAFEIAAWSINPQVHAFDDRSLVENLAPQAATVESARAFLGATPIAITPVTFRPRFNPQAKVQPPDPADKLPFRYDARQASLFGAAWTLGSLKYLCEAGPASVTYFETAGRGGVVTGDARNPLFQVLADVAAFAGGEAIPMTSDAPLDAVALLLRSGDRRRLLIGNLTPRVQAVRVTGVQFKTAEFGLQPHAVVRVDVGA